MTLCPEKILELFQEDGALQQCLRGFESRTQQQEMVQKVIEAFNEGNIALIEAGTGTGKSLAYLIPAVLWALNRGEKILISTKTIQLQEQLQYKDMPVVRKVLGGDFKSTIVKGMGNYVCLRKLEDAMNEVSLLSEKEANELQIIENWSKETKEGAKTGLPMAPSWETWDRVRSESEACPRKRCPHFEDCFFFKARKSAYSAQVLISNHHLLSADLSYRMTIDNYEDPVLLPKYDRIILDEAHHLEDIATNFFAKRVSYLDFLRPLARLASEKKESDYGKLKQLQKKISIAIGKEVPIEWSQLTRIFHLELPTLRKELLRHLGELFESLLQYFYTRQEKSTEKKYRLRNGYEKHSFWQKEVVPSAEALLSTTQRYLSCIKSIEQEITSWDRSELLEQTEGVRIDIAASVLQLQETCLTLNTFLQSTDDLNCVRWIEMSFFNKMPAAILREARLNIAQELAKGLFSRFRTIVLSSATLSTHRNFDFIRGRLGINLPELQKRKIEEAIYDSPFNYEEQALLLIPKDLPLPQDPKFLEKTIDVIVEAIHASRGNAFVLFTSYSMMLSCRKKISARLQKEGFPLMIQGEDHRYKLLNRFANTDRAVLFGTDSYWEGVDVLGDALRSVIIVKLPFQVPDEPIIQARAEAITVQGGNPFFDYSLPHAIVKFKQGFGRLIRHKNDRGCIVCLDSRLVTRPYGKRFLKSLPLCHYMAIEAKEVKERMTQFYYRSN